APRGRRGARWTRAPLRARLRAAALAGAAGRAGRRRPQPVVPAAAPLRLGVPMNPATGRRTGDGETPDTGRLALVPSADGPAGVGVKQLVRWRPWIFAVLGGIGATLLCAGGFALFAPPALLDKAASIGDGRLAGWLAAILVVN